MLDHFKRKYRSLLGNEFDEFFSALSEKEHKFVRMNTARGVDYTAEFSEGILEKDTVFSNVYRLTDPEFRFTDSIGFQTGGFYIQNPSSLFPVEVLASRMPEMPVVLDMSAAPGGKTTALSEALNRDGLIVANEIAGSRMKFLNYNLEKYGAWNVKTISRDGRVLNTIFDDVFDGVLLDAPCSNENKIVKTREVASAWCDDLVNRMQKLQQELILSAFDVLKPGGFLVYSTCTFSVEENEQVVEYLLENRPDAAIVNVNGGEYPVGMSGNTAIDEAVLRVMPHKMPYDGFFIACVQKKGELCPSQTDVTKYTDPYKIDRFFTTPMSAGVLSEVKGYCFYESNYNHLRFPMKKTGIKFGRLIKDRLEISSQAIWEFGDHLKKPFRIDIEHHEALEYLKGCDIRKIFPQKDAFAVYYKDIPVGTVKHVQNGLKNKLDRFFLYGRNT